MTSTQLGASINTTAFHIENIYGKLAGVFQVAGGRAGDPRRLARLTSTRPTAQHSWARIYLNMWVFCLGTTLL
jgi:hypothetical protein